MIIQSNNSKTEYFTTQTETESKYDAFGNITEGQTVSSIGYSGEYLDAETGLYYLTARFYDPETGRFTQEDDWLTEGPNLYIYCRNNPVMYSDPSGHCNAYDLIYYRKKGDMATLEKLKRIIANGDCESKYYHDPEELANVTHQDHRNYTFAIYVSDYTEYGVLILGHARLYIMDTSAEWWMTEFTGEGLDKSSAKVSTYNVLFDSILEDLNKPSFRIGDFYFYGTEAILLYGDFTESLELAKYYGDAQSYPEYLLFTNNCLHYIQLILSKGKYETELQQKFFSNPIDIIPKLYLENLKK